ncbi:MAG: GNAT family N-acetyltransferase [Candidatus Dormibacteria bacterium]
MLVTVLAVPHLTVFNNRIRTERLELRLPDLEQLDELATLAARGIHPPETMPFGVPWTDLPPTELERGVVRFNLFQLGNWRQESWSFNPVVLLGGQVVGTQGISAENFGVTRTFKTGSWLGQAHQRQGGGREMRAAILHFGFVSLGARVAESAAFRDNPASIALSRSLGYQENGEFLVERRGLAAEQLGLRLTRERWEATARSPVVVEGVEGCLELFGV